MVLDAVVLLYDVLAPDCLPFLLLGVVLTLDKVWAHGLDIYYSSGHGLGSQFRLQIVVPAIRLTPVAMVIVRLADHDNG